MRVLAVCTALIGASIAHADDTACLAALEGFERAGAVTLDVAFPEAEYDRVTFRPHEDVGDLVPGVYHQVNGFRGKDGRTWDGVDHWKCREGALVHDRMVFDPSRGIEESFDPPMPWLKLPLRTGDTWAWKGDMTVTDGGDPATFLVGVSFAVGTAEPIETPAGTFEATPVTYDLQIPARDGFKIEQTTWYVSGEKWFVAKRERTTWIGGFKQPDPATWTLVSLGAAPAAE